MQQTVGGSASTGTYGYDADGDTTTRPGQTITYDPEGKVSTIRDGTNTESDIYDADGNLLLQMDSATGSTLFNGAMNCTSRQDRPRLLVPERTRLMVQRLLSAQRRLALPAVS